MVGVFHKAERIRQEHRDVEAWKQGMYVMQAIQCTIGNAFLGKGKTPAEYPKQPMLTEERLKREAEKKIKEEEKLANEKAFASAYMMSMMDFGKNWGKHKE